MSNSLFDDAVESIMKATGMSREEAAKIAVQVGQTDHEQTGPSGDDQNWEYNGYAAHWSPDE